MFMMTPQELSQTLAKVRKINNHIVLGYWFCIAGAIVNAIAFLTVQAPGKNFVACVAAFIVLFIVQRKYLKFTQTLYAPVKLEPAPAR